MAQTFGWGILGPGRIARKFAAGVNAGTTGHIEAVASRSQERADAFCQAFGGRPYGAYDALLEDPDVHGVYIATPHHLHAQQAIECAQAGKHVLVEKPCALDERSARQAVDACQQAGVMFCEAFMYRFHPRMQALLDLVRSGGIGTVMHVQSEFGFRVSEDWVDIRSVLDWGGGALMDLGCYCVSFSRLMYGAEPDRATYLFHPAPKGYDGVASGSLRFPGGGTASFGNAVHCRMANEAWVYGTEGRIQLPSQWNEGSSFIWHRDGLEPEICVLPVYDLYGNQADVFVGSLEAGEVEMMTPADSLGNMRVLDMLRADGGLDFSG